ncbi:MAG: hypothetical protein IK083_05290 [Abditibacteriota bacterium]|nr:hypothetical protein [Abditibacteriota bacterium]
MNIDRAEELAELLRGSGCSQLTVKEGDTLIRLKKAPAGRRAAKEAPAKQARPADKTVEVRSDMVGMFTFAEPFAPGARVEAGRLIGHIKSFSIVNDVLAPCDGAIAEIRCEDDAPVEYGQVIMILKTGG